MRHLHFTQSLEVLNGGGLGASCAALHRQFLASGTPSVLCSTHGGTAQQPDASTREFRRIKPDFIYYSPAMHLQARGLVQEADVLHGHGMYVGTNFVFGREGRRQQKPLVYHVQGMFEPWILGRSRWKKKSVHWLFEDANFRNVRLWRALTEREAGQIRARGVTAPIVIAPNGLNLNEYSRPGQTCELVNTPLIPELKKTGLRLVFMSRIHPKKGLDLLLPAWMRMGSLRKGWELVIAGPDEGGYLTEVRQLAGPDSIRERVLFTGPVTGRAKSGLLQSADLFVLPSYSEGFPVSLLEAMACEVPVVATRACNCPEVSGAEAGWECDATLDSLTQALQQAIQCAENERLQRGRNGRRLVETRFTWPRIASILLDACNAHC
jgi:glycosyltransferase involved in cell wall biosynthesis